MTETALRDALVAEAARRSGVCWLSWATATGAVQDRLAWHTWYEGAVLLVAGGAEQELPGLRRATEASVTLRAKESRARLVTWTASVEEVLADDLRWPVLTAALLTDRLNHVGAEETLVRWAEESSVLVLRPLDA